MMTSSETNGGTQPEAMTGAQQTYQTWTRVLERSTDLPSPFAASWTQIAGAGPWPAWAVHSPALDGLSGRSCEQVLAIREGAIHCFTLKGRKIAHTSLGLDSISDFERGTVLLNSWIRIRGQDPTGKDASILVEFNTATARHYDPLIAMLRPAARPASTGTASMRETLADLESRSYKFLNMAMEVLTNPAEVETWHWHDHLKRPSFPLTRLLLGRDAESTRRLDMITHTEFLSMTEDNRVKPNRGERPGGIWHHVPRSRIQAARVHTMPGNLVQLELDLKPGNRSIALLYNAGDRPLVESMASLLAPALNSRPSSP